MGAERRLAIVPAPNFRAEVEVADMTALVSLFGELDRVAGGVCERTVYGIELAVRHVVIDLRGLTHMNRSGLFALLHVQARSRLLDWRLTLVRGPLGVDEVFQPAFINRLFDWVDRADRGFRRHHSPRPRRA